MRIVGASGPTGNFTSAARRGTEERDPQAPETGARALIPITASVAGDGSPSLSRHPAAPFLAQLIATQMQAPQTRARRRAAPEDAIAIYRSMTKPVSPRRPLGKRA